MTSPSPSSASGASRGIRITGLACLALALAMVGAAFAAVPLYTMFCKLTGFGGTPLVGTSAPGEVLARNVNVRFDTNVAPGLSWSFRAETSSVDARLGETQTVFFRVRNDGPIPATGVSSFNVQPDQAAAYFVKMKCFCFEEQTLQPGETMDFPVVFYIDPEIVKNRDLDAIGAMTLSYTYFASKSGQPMASVQGATKPRL